MSTVDDVVYSESEVGKNKHLEVLVWLLVLLVATFSVSLVNIPSEIKTGTAAGIAFAKAALIVWDYMHLRSSPRIILAFLATIGFMIVIVALMTMSDYASR